MLRNYLKVAVRSIIKEKYYALINITGLAIGVASVMIILVFLHFQMSYDKQHPDYENTYRVNQTAFWSFESEVMSSTPIPLADVLLNDYPEIVEVTRINTPYDAQIMYDNGEGDVKIYNENDILAADSNFFDFFGFKLAEGEKSTALKEINSVVVSAEMAEKYFGDEPALGKILMFGEDRKPVRVTGVTEKQPDNIHFDFDFLISMHTNPAIKKFEWSWIWTQMVTYVKLKPGTNPTELEKKFGTIARTHAVDAFRRLQIDLDEFEAERGAISFYLQKVEDIHLYSAGIGNRIGNTGDITYIYIFGIIAVFILIIASINFTNLSTARSVTRAREIGVRKVLGSLKGMLVSQYLIESLILTLAATMIGFIILELVNSSAMKITGIDTVEIILQEYSLLGILLLIPVVLGLLAGIYPAFYMTRFNPADVLKGKLFSGLKGSKMRNSLVVFQFAISISLIICSISVHRQLTYFHTADLGFQKENLMVINYAEKLGDNLEPYLNELRSYPAVENTGLAFQIPGRGAFEDFFYAPGKENEEVSMSAIKIDEHFIPSMGMDMIMGRNFSEEYQDDVNNVILNEAAMLQFGWNPENVIGQEVSYFGEATFRVVGVVRNFNFQSLRSSIDPLAYFHIDSKMYGDRRSIVVRYPQDKMEEVVGFSESKWNTFSEETAFNYNFLDEELSRLYEGEQQTADLFRGFTIIAVLIACIGLFGLSSYTIEQRKKEIGIRKVLGSSVNSVVLLLNKSYTTLVILGFLIAAPVSWWGVNKWLQQFTYKVEVELWTFFLAGAIAVAIMWITVGYQSIRAAMVNPVESLKDE